MKLFFAMLAVAVMGVSLLYVFQTLPRTSNAAPLKESTNVVRSEACGRPRRSMAHTTLGSGFIVVGRITQVSDRVPHVTNPVTGYEFQSEKYLKGDAPALFRVRVPGGPLSDGRILSFDGDVQFQPGHRYLLFGSPLGDTYNIHMAIMLENGVGVLPRDDFEHDPRGLRFVGPDQLVGKTEAEIEETIHSVLVRYDMK